MSVHLFSWLLAPCGSGVFSFNPFACLVLRAVAATAIFVELEAVGVAGQKDARNERPYIFNWFSGVCVGGSKGRTERASVHILLVFRWLRWWVRRTLGTCVRTFFAGFRGGVLTFFFLAAD